MLNGFKSFIMKGNVIDLAVAVIMGAAFGAVVDALVKSVLMPAISVLIGQHDFNNFLVVGPVKFGVLLTAIVNFLLFAASIYFVIIVPMNKMIEHRNRKLGIKDKSAETPVDPQIALLTEIRDALKSRDREL